MRPQVQKFYEKHHRLPLSVANVICPGNKIPEWFSCENEGSSINIKLPLHWYDANSLGFAVAVQYLGHLRCFSFKCKSSFKTKQLMGKAVISLAKLKSTWGSVLCIIPPTMQITCWCGISPLNTNIVLIWLILLRPLSTSLLQTLNLQI